MKFADNSAGQEMPKNYEKIKEIFKPDSLKETVERLNNYKDQSDPFIVETKQFIEKNSPLVMMLTFEIIKRGRQMSVREALELDFRIMQGLLNFPDHHTGVHQLLVKKTRTEKPEWAFQSIDEVHPGIVDYFMNYPD